MTARETIREAFRRGEAWFLMGVAVAALMGMAAMAAVWLSSCAAGDRVTVRQPYLEPVPDRDHGIVCYRDRDSGSVSCVRPCEVVQPPIPR